MKKTQTKSFIDFFYRDRLLQTLLSINRGILVPSFLILHSSNKQIYSKYNQQINIKQLAYYKHTIMKGVHFLLTVTVLALATSIASAYDPSPLQDFCIAVDDPNKACKYYSSFFFFLNLGLGVPLEATTALFVFLIPCYQFIFLHFTLSFTVTDFQLLKVTWN